MRIPKSPAEKEELLRQNLKWHSKAKAEFLGLPRKLQIEVIDHLVKAVVIPGYGQDLENKFGMDLTGCIKIYFDEAKKRIVFEIDNDGKLKIWAVGKRNELGVYHDVNLRRQEEEDRG